jgi:MFS family permease
MDIMRALPFGLYQYLLIAIHLMLYVSSSFVVYNVGFLQMNPVYECTTYADGGSTLKAVSCSREEMCRLREQLGTDKDPAVQAKSWRVDWNDPHSLWNWTTWLDLHCDSMYVGFFGTLYFLGFLISSLIFPPMSDRIGRKKMFMVGSLIQFLTFIGMLLFKSSLAM